MRREILHDFGVSGIRDGKNAYGEDCSGEELGEELPCLGKIRFRVGTEDGGYLACADIESSEFVDGTAVVDINETSSAKAS